MNDLLQRGPEILPGTPEYEWMSSVVAKAAEYAGRPSHWNGKLYEQPGPVSGLYQPDGSMTISREHVLDPARPAFTPEHTATPNELSAAAGATHMAIFQARLSLSELGDGPCLAPPRSGRWRISLSRTRWPTGSPLGTAAGSPRI